MIYHKRIASTYWNHPFRPAFATLVMLLLHWSCSPTEKVMENVERFPIINPVVADTVYNKQYVADIQAIQNIELRAKTSGYLESIHVDEGQHVNKGQLLFVVSGRQFTQELMKARAALTSALADVKAAEVELSNARTLVEKAIVSKVELELAEARLEALMAKVEEARVQEASASLQLSFAQIKAPFSGFINRIPKKVGSLIDEGTLLTTLSDNREIFAYFNVSEREYLDYVSENASERDEIELILNNGKSHPHKGKIETIDGEIDRSTGNIAFRARFPNPNQIIKHGSSGKVLVKHRLEGVTLIPQKSTFEIQDNHYVYVVDDDNTVQRKRIVPSIRLPHTFVVNEGLSTQDKVLYEGIQRVREGDRVTPETVQPEIQLSYH